MTDFEVYPVEGERVQFVAGKRSNKAAWLVTEVRGRGDRSRMELLSAGGHVRHNVRPDQVELVALPS